MNRLLISCLILALSGCQTIINQYAPPLTPEEQSLQAAKISMEAITDASRANIYTGFNSAILKEEFEKAIANASIPELALEKPQVRFDNQKISVDADITYVDSDNEITVHGSVSGNVSLALSSQSLVWLPTFNSIVINKVDGSLTAELFRKLGNSILKKYIYNINRILYSMLQEDNKNIVPLFIEPIRSIGVTSGIHDFANTQKKNNLASRISYKDKGLAFHISESSILVSKEKVEILAEVISAGTLAYCSSDDAVKINRFVFSKSVKDREPVDPISKITEDLKVITAFFEFNGKPGDEVIVHWFAKGEVKAPVSLKVGSSSWRTWSTKNMGASFVGDTWDVFVVDKYKNCIVGYKSIISAVYEDTQNQNVDEFEKNYASFKSKFDLIRRNLVETIPEGAQGWAYLDKSVISDLVNSTFRNLNLSATADLSTLEKMYYDGKLAPFNKKDIDCKSKRDCTEKKDCTSGRVCKRGHDTRNCSACLLRVFGRCQAKGNDPFCEIQKATQNEGYKIAYNTCLVQKKGEEEFCNVRKKAKEEACNLEKTTEKAFCEVGREAVGALQNSGPIASISGDAYFKKGNASYSLNSLEFSQNLSSFNTNHSIGFNFDLRASIDWTPTGIAGHLTCLSKWKESVDMNFSYTNSNQALNLPIAFVQSGGKSFYRVNIPKVDLGQIKIKPPPAEALFIDHPHLLVNCVVLASASAVGEKITGDKTGFLTGKVPLEYEGAEFDIELSNYNLTLGGDTYEGSFIDGTKYIGTVLNATN